MLGVAGVPSMIQLIGMVFMPETPVYLYKCDQVQEADRVLGKLYLAEYVEAKKREL